jgi:predicted transposase/invertase (TIGR01784 family)
MSSRELISFDWAMKRLLRNKANFGILNGFLTELIKDEISVQHILESESNRENEQNKSNRLDLLCVNQKDELIAIEIQYYVEPDYFHRCLFGVSKIITEYLSKGDPYSLVKKVYSINILYFDLGMGIDYVYIGRTNFVGMHHSDTLMLSEKQVKMFDKKEPSGIFPEYYLLKINKFDNLAKNTLDEWIYFLKIQNCRKTIRYQRITISE